MKKFLFLFLFSFSLLGFSGEYDNILNGIHSYLGNIEADTNSLGGLPDQLVSVESILRDMYSTSQGIYTILSTRPFTDISTNVFTIANRLSQTNTSLADLKTSVDSATSAVSSIDTTTQSIDTKIGISNTHLANVNTKITTLTTEVSSIKTDVASMKSDLHSVAQTISSGTSPIPPTRIQSLPVPSSVSALDTIQRKLFPPRFFSSTSRDRFTFRVRMPLHGTEWDYVDFAGELPLSSGHVDTAYGGFDFPPGMVSVINNFFSLFRTGLLILLAWCFLKVVIKTLRQW